MVTACKKSIFILSKTLDFFMVDNLSIEETPFSMHMLTSLSVDEILLPRYLGSRRKQVLLMPAFGYAIEIRLVY